MISTTDGDVLRFDCGSFNDVIDRYNNFVCIDEEKIDVGNVVGYDCVNQCLCSVRHISEKSMNRESISYYLVELCVYK